MRLVSIAFASIFPKALSKRLSFGPPSAIATKRAETAPINVTNPDILPTIIAMAEQQSPDYKKLFFEEQRRREEEQRRREAAEQAQDRAKEKTRKTTLPEYLDACHTHLHSSLTVQTDTTLSTRGDPANATNKL
ncbi:hypothetical protein BCR34DRAFT_594435 [Clohesyomyces aquaticus]|uniref:Uncharacterized protein n=1 Tax=Clohesyomyces aquaticus TaxID=1231657 RepID=A0A1Y1Y8U4_9PLEO|nr:hypothetical protein BCR34DRAFT_594435 [Clohesyomyces aquaticus]